MIGTTRTARPCLHRMAVHQEPAQKDDGASQQHDHGHQGCLCPKGASCQERRPAEVSLYDPRRCGRGEAIRADAENAVLSEIKRRMERTWKPQPARAQEGGNEEQST